MRDLTIKTTIIKRFLQPKQHLPFPGAWWPPAIWPGPYVPLGRLVQSGGRSSACRRATSRWWRRARLWCQCLEQRRQCRWGVGPTHVSVQAVATGTRRGKLFHVALICMRSNGVQHVQTMVHSLQAIIPQWVRSAAVNTDSHCWRITRPSLCLWCDVIVLCCDISGFVLWLDCVLCCDFIALWCDIIVFMLWRHSVSLMRYDEVWAASKGHFGCLNIRREKNFQAFLSTLSQMS